MRRNDRGTLLVFAIAVVAGLGFVVQTSQGQLQGQDGQPGNQPTNQQSHREFMRAKLAASNQILEGLALDNMDLVKAGADKLTQTSAAQRFRVNTNPIYAHFADEFNRNTQALAKAAESRNLDQSALKWMAVTMNCIDCHRFVRNELIAGQQNPKP